MKKKTKNEQSIIFRAGIILYARKLNMNAGFRGEGGRECTYVPFAYAQLRSRYSFLYYLTKLSSVREAQRMCVHRTYLYMPSVVRNHFYVVYMASKCVPVCMYRAAYILCANFKAHAATA